MAYGRSLSDAVERRMVDLGRSKTSTALSELREKCLMAKNHFATTIWPESLLDELPQGKAFDAVALEVQSSFKGQLNSVWAEKCRIQTSDNLKEQFKRARGACSEN